MSRPAYGPKKISMELIVRRRTGATNTLFKKADAAPKKDYYFKSICRRTIWQRTLPSILWNRGHVRWRYWHHSSFTTCSRLGPRLCRWHYCHAESHFGMGATESRTSTVGKEANDQYFGHGKAKVEHAM